MPVAGGWGGGVATPSFRLASSGPGSYTLPHALLVPSYITWAASFRVTSSFLTVLTLTKLVPFLGKAAIGFSEWLSSMWGNVTNDSQQTG